MLVVRFDRIEPNRATAYSGSLLAPYTVDPASIAARVDREPKRLIWQIDSTRRVGRVESADMKPSVLELPLRPMLGCVAVAPARKEAILTSVPGPFGGNMDYAGLNAGVTLMLPVNEPGALLFLGDGHARQGDGEVAGTGLEISMDVEFTVDIVKKKPISWPRIVNDTHIIVHSAASAGCVRYCRRIGRKVATRAGSPRNRHGDYSSRANATVVRATSLSSSTTVTTCAA